MHLWTPCKVLKDLTKPVPSQYEVKRHFGAIHGVERCEARSSGAYSYG